MTQPNTGSAHRKGNRIPLSVSYHWESPICLAAPLALSEKESPAQTALRIPIPFIGISGCPFRVLDDGETSALFPDWL